MFCAGARNIGDRKYLINGAAPIVARAQIDWPCEVHKFVAHDVNDVDSICAERGATSAEHCVWVCSDSSNIEFKLIEVRIAGFQRLTIGCTSTRDAEEDASAQR